MPLPPSFPSISVTTKILKYESRGQATEAFTSVSSAPIPMFPDFIPSSKYPGIPDPLLRVIPFEGFPKWSRLARQNSISVSTPSPNPFVPTSFLKSSFNASMALRIWVSEMFVPIPKGSPTWMI